MDNTPVYQFITDRLEALADECKARDLSRFFKTGKGEYGEGDMFLGIPVPQTRLVVREFRHSGEIADVKLLVTSRWHEVRLAGFLLLVEIYARAKKKHDEISMRQTVDFYLSVLDRGNNWDLVDLVAPKILGAYLSSHPEERWILYDLAEMDGRLWHQRTAIVSTWTLMRDGEFTDTFRLCDKLIAHKHDLIHKACGWMLREAGKRGALSELKNYLELNGNRMPRTMLRYAIEKFSPEERKYYLVKR